VYSVPEGVHNQYWEHYTHAYYFGFQYKDNFHYFGNEKNQLLPLISTLWNPSDPSSERHKGAFFPAWNVTFTDLLGCHGTSGSGILQRNSWGHWELLGPTSTWGPETVGEELCQDQSGLSPGARGLAYPALAQSQYLSNLVDECYAYDAGPYITTHFALDCFRIYVAILPWRLRDWPWPPCLSCPPYERLRWWNDPMVIMDPSLPLTMPGTPISAGQRYRLFIRTVPFDATPPLMNLRVGDQLIAANLSPTIERTASGELDQRGIGFVGLTFNALLDGPQDVQIVPTDGSGQFGIEEVTLVLDGSVNTFDTMTERKGAGLQRYDRQGLILEPMRFTGDTGEGLAALLRPAERFILTRQAWVPGQVWNITFQTSAAPGVGAPNLFCGFILSDGREISTPCDPDSNGTSRVTLFPPSSAEPIGFYVEPSAQVQDSLTIDNVAIQSWLP
jgi:hypothetical protein